MNSEPKTPDLTEQLAKLGKLHADGVLSDKDFKALKSKLIGGIGVTMGIKAKNGVKSSEANEATMSNPIDDTLRRIDGEVQQIRREQRYEEAIAWVGLFIIVLVALYAYIHVTACQFALTRNNFSSHMMDACINGAVDLLQNTLSGR